MAPRYHRPVTHYEVLGVPKNASSTEIRRAYVQLARQHHPDVNATASSSGRAASEREMRRINEAWAVLGDGERRQRYDTELRTAVSRPVPKPRRPPGTANPDFVPYDTGDDDLDESALDDTPIPGTTLPRWLQLLGPGFLLAAVALFCVGLVTSLNELTSLAVVSFIFALVSFVATPLVAVHHSARAERR